MTTTLGEETLATGERLAIFCVEAPDAQNGEEISPFLGHKPASYRKHIDDALADKGEGLETRFYVGRLDGEIVANIMTTEFGGVGIFGHVFTRPDQRRKGISRAVIARQMEDFRRRDGATLLLGTGYGSSAYRIYAEAGFVDAPPCSPGTMRYDNPAVAPAETRFAGSQPRRIAPATWRHWPGVALLGVRETPEFLRCPGLGVWGARLLEGPYCAFQLAAEPGDGAALEDDFGTVFALAIRQGDRRGTENCYTLDLLAHPATPPAELARTIAAVEKPGARFQCLADPRDAVKIAALEAAGYARVAVLPDQFREEGVWREAFLYSRTADR